MSDTKIEWTDATWSPVTGCTPVSDGCAHCWARDLHERRHKAYLAGKPMPAQYAQPFNVVQLHEDRLQDPLHWRKGRKIAVCLGADLFHGDVPDAFIDKVFAVMALCPQHTFQVLTKRPERMRGYFRSFTAPSAFSRAWNTCAWVRDTLGRSLADLDAIERIQRGLSNVWLGTSIEDQPTANVRIPLLLETRAAVHYVSYEPALERVDLRRIAVPDEHAGKWAGHGFTFNALCPEDDLTLFNSPSHLDLVIVGGESGAKPRPCDVAWIRSVVQQCQAAGVACFVKQLGTKPVDSAYSQTVLAGKVHYTQPVGSERDLDHRRRIADGSASGYTQEPMALRLKARKGNDPTEWPADLRVRQLPEVR